MYSKTIKMLFLFFAVSNTWHAILSCFASLWGWAALHSIAAAVSVAFLRLASFED